MSTALRDAAEAGAAVLRRAVAGGDLPGAAFAVGQSDVGPVLLDAFGVADVATGRAVSAATPFCLASTTKPIATTTLAALWDLDVLDVDSPVTDLVPEFRVAHWSDRPPTLREVASHTAGLGPHHRFFYADERAPVPVEDAVRSLARPTLPVGAQWRYSNLGYGVLQLAMERASGESMESLVQRHVYSPLGMAQSSWGGTEGPPGAAARHLTMGDTYPGYVTDHPPASEAWASVADLLRFGLAHARSALLSPAAHELIAQPFAPRQADGAAYALGWVTRDYGDVRVLIHGGRMGGVGAHLTVVPSLGIVVAAVANIETDRLSEAVAAVLGAVVPQYEPPPAASPWQVGAAHPLVAGRWEGFAALGDDTLPVVLDTLGARITLQVSGRTTDVVMPHLQPDAVLGHAAMAIEHPLAPTGSICHLDAVPMRLADGRPTGLREGERPDVVIGSLVSAQYPGPGRERQGDAVSAAMWLERVE